MLCEQFIYLINQEIVKETDEIRLQRIHSFKYQVIFSTVTAQQGHGLKATAGHVHTMLVHGLHKTHTTK